VNGTEAAVSVVCRRPQASGELGRLLSHNPVVSLYKSPRIVGEGEQ
jgi:hypothetical protein